VSLVSSDCCGNQRSPVPTTYGRGQPTVHYPRPVPSQIDKATLFLSLHQGATPLLLPNPWDAGSAKLLTSLGFEALATTSSGFAATLGRLDGTVTRDESLLHARTIVEATRLPVSADLENGFAHDPASVAETVRLAIECGLSGCSIEDSTGRADSPLYDLDRATERVAAAAQAAHTGDVHLVLTARAENHLHGRHDLADTITRLRHYGEAGADVLYAPGVTRLEDIRQIVDSVNRPVNVLALPGAPPVAELAAAGVSRISVGGAFAFAALGAVVRASRELLDEGTYGFWEQAGPGAMAARAAFA
jgi:2-methylisocitrate lyase-like PEP mutase family enzyme